MLEARTPFTKRLCQIRVMLALFAGLMGARGALATDRYYPDLTEVSENGVFRLEAKSPDNRIRPYPFAKHFEYTLTDTRSGRVLWTRAQAHDEGSPQRVFVSDDGWVMAYTSHETFLAMDPLSGRAAIDCRIQRHIVPEEWLPREPIISPTSILEVGPHHFYFLRHEGRTHFVVRAWWDIRLVLDLDRADRIAKPARGLIAACEESEGAFALRVLERAPDRLMTPADIDWAFYMEALTAAHLAGALRLKEAAPTLRTLAQPELIRFAHVEWVARDGALQEGDIEVSHAVHLQMRAMCHLALRRLGERPPELPTSLFIDPRAEGLVRLVRLSPLPCARTERVDAIRPGMTAVEVVNTIGAPDRNHTNDDASWEYDIDDQQPYTLRLGFNEEHLVEQVTRIRPARWRRGEDVLREIIWAW